MCMLLYTAHPGKLRFAACTHQHDFHHHHHHATHALAYVFTSICTLQAHSIHPHPNTRPTLHDRFDWFFKSRTPPELQRRADTLIRLIEKELEDEGVSERHWGGGGTRMWSAGSGSRGGVGHGGSEAGEQRTWAGGGAAVAEWASNRGPGLGRLSVLGRVQLIRVRNRG